MNEFISKRPGQIPKRYWKIIFEKDGPNCSECGERIILPDEYENLSKRIKDMPKGYQKPLQFLKFSFGHVKPSALGGEDTLDNIVGEHFWCNEKKKINLKLKKEQLFWIKNYAHKYIPELLKYLDK